MPLTRKVVIAVCFILASIAMKAEEGQRFAQLGDCKLQNGDVIRDCRIGYRVFGELNRDRSNAIVFPTWFTGTSKALEPMIGPGKLIDSSKYYVIAVDSLSNGISSSPSNSKVQPRLKFPHITIADMVTSEYRLITEELSLRHLFAVVGISMGGMQTFEWMVRYPGMMDVAVPLTGAPQVSTSDQLLWKTQLNAIQMDPAYANGDYEKSPKNRTLAGLMAMVITTPKLLSQVTPRGKVDESIGVWEQFNLAIDMNDRVRQTEALIGQDISADFGGSLDAAANAVSARVLVIVSSQDHTVNPLPALDFAKKIGAQTVVLEGDCGHLATTCESQKVVEAVNKFLEETRLNNRK